MIFSSTRSVVTTVLPTLLLGTMLSACGGGGSSSTSVNTTAPANEVANSTTPQSTPKADPARRLPAYETPGVDLVYDDTNADAASCEKQQALVGGRNYPVQLTSASGETITFQVFEPANIDCVHGHPLVFHGHGFGGQRITDPAGTIVERLLNNGYAVISIDQRGFHDSSGTVRVMDPNFEGRDLLQILDWAESHMDYLAHDLQPGGNYNLAAGAVGGSYGGMYQLLMHNIDPQHRLDVLTPDITPDDLRYSLSPNGVIKSAWALLLVAGGETGANQPLIQGLDPVIKETLVRGATFNVIHDGALPFFYYHSAKYFLDALPASEQQPMSFVTEPLSGGLDYEFPAVKPVPVDILFTQGIRDTLFNFNDGWANYNGYKALGGDVRMLTHESGHILPSVKSLRDQLGPLSDTSQTLLDGINSLGLSVTDTQQPAGLMQCGDLSQQDAVIAFLNQKLNPGRAEQMPASVLAELDRLRDQICLSTADGKALWVDPDHVDNLNRVATGIPQTQIPIPNGLSGLTSLPAPVFIPLDGVLGANDTLAGIGHLDVTLSLPLPFTVPQGCQAITELPSEAPATGCDAIIYVGWGARSGTAAPRLIDDQITPLRGLGDHQVDMVGVAEKLAEGEQLGLLVYGYHPQYFTSVSRDVLVPAVTLQGTVQVPVN